MDATTELTRDLLHGREPIGGTFTQLGDAVGGEPGRRRACEPGATRCGWLVTVSRFSDLGSGTATVQLLGPRLRWCGCSTGSAAASSPTGPSPRRRPGADELDRPRTAWSWSVSGGGEISSRDYRYHGLMSSQPPKWDVTGNDMYVAAQAGGPLRILGQGSKPPVSSPIKRAIQLQSGSNAPVTYWPMEDAAGASVFGAAPPSRRPGPVTGEAATASSLPLQLVVHLQLGTAHHGGRHAARAGGRLRRGHRVGGDLPRGPHHAARVQPGRPSSSSTSPAASPQYVVMVVDS